MMNYWGRRKGKYSGCGEPGGSGGRKRKSPKGPGKMVLRVKSRGEGGGHRAHTKVRSFGGSTRQ